MVKAVDDVSFQIHEGETFALVGESGCGKSTIANLILKLLDPSSGEILYRGSSLTDMSTQETRRTTVETCRPYFKTPTAR